MSIFASFSYLGYLPDFQDCPSLYAATLSFADGDSLTLTQISLLYLPRLIIILVKSASSRIFSHSCLLPHYFSSLGVTDLKTVSVLTWGIGYENSFGSQLSFLLSSLINSMVSWSQVCSSSCYKWLVHSQSTLNPACYPSCMRQTEKLSTSFN